LYRHKESNPIAVEMFQKMTIPNNQIAYMKDMPMEGKEHAY